MFIVDNYITTLECQVQYITDVNDRVCIQGTLLLRGESDSYKIKH